MADRTRRDKRQETSGRAPGDDPEAVSAPVERTGVPYLDDILAGGIPRGSLVIIVGPPGSGKTTLANQVAFTAARAGRRAVVVTALSEPSSKLLAHLRTFDFYDDDLVGDAVQFMSLEQFLPNGLHASSDELIAIARQTRAHLVVLDGFRGVRGADNDPQAARQFLYDVGTTLSALGATTLISSEADPHDPAFFPETTTADVILGLQLAVAGSQQRRGLEVVKLRGASPKPGMHAFAIARQGALVFPRFETQLAIPSPQLAPDEGRGTGTPVGAAGAAAAAGGMAAPSAAAEELASFGLPALDGVLHGGLTRGTSTLVIGSLGAGKTLLGLQFAAAGVQAGEPTLYLGFRESRPQLLNKIAPFTLGAALTEALAPGGLFAAQHWNPVDLHPDIVTARLLETLDRAGTRRLVLDSIAELEHAVARRDERERLSDFLAALLVALRERGITALIIKEHDATVASELSLSAAPISVLAENVLLLQQLVEHGALRRILSVVKMRFSAHDSLLHDFVIRAPAGIQLDGRVGGDPAS